MVIRVTPSLESGETYAKENRQEMQAAVDMIARIRDLVGPDTDVRIQFEPGAYPVDGTIHVPS
jgi:hypothetical protein